MPSLEIAWSGVWGVIGGPQQILKVLLTRGGDKTYNIQTVHVAVCVWKTCMYMTLRVFSRSEFGLVHVSLRTGVEHSAFQRFRVTGSLRKENSVHENSI